MVERLHLSERHCRALQALLREHLPGVEVWAYGSRVNGRSHDGSDLDLALRGPGLEEIPAKRLTAFKEAVRESTIPFLVEARDWARLPERFHREIEREYVVLRKLRLPRVQRLLCWSRVGLGAVIDLLTGYPFKSAQYTNARTEPRLLRGDNIAQGTLRWSGAKRWEATSVAIDARYWLQEGDVVLARDRPWIEAGLKYARVGRRDLPALLVQRVARLRGSNGLDSRFLYYVIGNHDFIQHVRSVQTGTAVPHISARQIKEFEFCLPSFSEQRAIAHILGTLDDKIDLNRRMNATLEAMARAIFKDWFVDFGPTRAKAEGRAPYLPPELWDLFPDALDDQGKPVGWSIYTLSDLATHHRATLLPDAQPERIYEHYSIPAYDAGGEPATDLGGSIRSSKTIVPAGAVLLSKLNPEIERVWLPNSDAEAPQIASTEFLALTPLAPATRSVLYCLFRSPGFRAEMTARVTGTSKSHQRVPPKSLLACEVLAADVQLFALFDGKVEQMLNRLLLTRRESRELAQSRDLLLPRLMSGEIRVPDAERIAEAVA